MRKLFVALLLLVNFSNAWALADGTCSYQSTFDPPIPTSFVTIGTPPADIYNPFFSTTMTVKVTCQGPLTTHYYIPTLIFTGAADNPNRIYLKEFSEFPGISGGYSNMSSKDNCKVHLMQSFYITPAIDIQPRTYSIVFHGDGDTLPAGMSCEGTVTMTLNYYFNGNTLDTNLQSLTTHFSAAVGGVPGTYNFIQVKNVDHANSSVSGMNSFKIVPPSCVATIGMVTPFANNYATVQPKPAGSAIVTKDFTIDLTCTPPINLYSWNNQSQVILGVGTTASPLVGGIAGVNARLTSIALDTSKTNCTLGIAQNFTQTDTTTTIGTTGLAAGAKFTGGNCTNHYIARVAYTTTGAAFNGVSSSTQYLTDSTSSQYVGFLQPGNSLTDLQVNSSVNSFNMREDLGSCTAVIRFLDGAYVSSYKAVKSVTNTPFLTKNVQVELKCRPSFYVTAGDTQLVMGVGSAKSALLDGIKGVEASMTPFTLNTAASNCPNGFAKNLDQTPTTTIIKTNADANYLIADLLTIVTTDGTCTNTYNATLNYYATGDAFNTTPSSRNNLTDKVGTYSNFLKAGNYPANVAISSVGLNPFTVSQTNCRVVLSAKVRK